MRLDQTQARTDADGFKRFFSRLLARELRPIQIAKFQRVSRMAKIMLGIFQPFFCNRLFGRVHTNSSQGSCNLAEIKTQSPAIAIGNVIVASPYTTAESAFVFTFHKDLGFARGGARGGGGRG